MSKKKIEKLWAFIADDTPENEGIMGVFTPEEGWVPLVTGREQLVPHMKKTALNIKQAAGVPARLVEFSERKVIEEL